MAQGQAAEPHRAPHRALSLSVDLPYPLQVLQSFSSIEEDCTVCPSWCLTLRARGHSCGAALERHIPQYSLDVPTVSVAPAAVGVGTGEPGFLHGLWIPLPFSLSLPGCRNLPTTSPWGSGPVNDSLGHGSGTGESLGLGQLLPACCI